jgi:ABC-type polysaccharide/polyol phosphate export permease
MLEIYRDALFYGKIPDMNILLPFTVFCVVLFAAGIWFFKKTKRGFGELL